MWPEAGSDLHLPNIMSQPFTYIQFQCHGCILCTLQVDLKEWHSWPDGLFTNTPPGRSRTQAHTHTCTHTFCLTPTHGKWSEDLQWLGSRPANVFHAYLRSLHAPYKGTLWKMFFLSPFCVKSKHWDEESRKGGRNGCHSPSLPLSASSLTPFFSPGRSLHAY